MECRTCDFAMSAAVLLDGKETNDGVGALGTVNSHATSNQHKAAVDLLKKAKEPPKKGSLPTFQRVERPQQQQHQMEPPGSSGPRQNGREREEAAAAASAREGNSSVKEVVLHGLVADLSHTDKHSLLLHISKQVLQGGEAAGGGGGQACSCPARAHRPLLLRRRF